MGYQSRVLICNNEEAGLISGIAKPFFRYPLYNYFTIKLHYTHINSLFKKIQEDPECRKAQDLSIRRN